LLFRITCYHYIARCIPVEHQLLASSHLKKQLISTFGLKVLNIFSVPGKLCQNGATPQRAYLTLPSIVSGNCLLYGREPPFGIVLLFFVNLA
jgi:hypothetical protein